MQSHPIHLLKQIIIGIFAFLPSVVFAADSTTQPYTREVIEYGKHKLQRFDVYTPNQALTNAPAVFMVHGGAWRAGDKASEDMIKNKLPYWLPKGIIVVSTNYRLVPEVMAKDQIDDVANALAAAQQFVEKRGGNSKEFIIMGHSAGAHLMAALASDPSIALSKGAVPWRGTIAIDTAGFNIVEKMSSWHPKFYNKPFGDDPAYWASVSPYHLISTSTYPILAICSKVRIDNPCRQARDFKQQAEKSGMQVDILPVDFNHMETSQMIGADKVYTQAIEKFMQKLSPLWEKTLETAIENP